MATPASASSLSSSSLRVVLLGFLVLSVLSGIILFFASAPKAKFAECDHTSIGFVIQGVIPTWLGGRNDPLGTARELWTCANRYMELYPTFVLTSFCLVYITLQTFAIPGPIVLSLLSGAMYPFIKAQILVALCATTGATLCFLLSHLLGRQLFQRMFPTMIQSFKNKVEQNRENLFYYMLFLRITPLLPNWFVNIASPLVDVPLPHFFFGTLLGLVPANFIHVSTGKTLTSAAGSEAQKSNFWNFATLFVLQFVALLPTIFKRKLEKYQQAQFDQHAAAAKDK